MYCFIFGNKAIMSLHFGILRDLRPIDNILLREAQVYTIK